MPLKMSTKVEALVSDLSRGLPLSEVARRYHVTRGYVFQVKEKHCKELWARANLSRKLLDLEAS